MRNWTGLEGMCVNRLGAGFKLSTDIYVEWGICILELHIELSGNIIV